MSTSGKALVLVVLLSACTVPTKGPATPSDCVRAMSSSAREGDAQAYLECFAGSLRESLLEAERAAGTEAFAESIRSRMRQVRGMAISEEGPVEGDNAALRIEWVFDDRNEVQLVTLLRQKGVWRIVDMKEAQYNKPEIPYGTEVF